MFTRAQVRKPYRIGLLFTHKNGDFGAISVTAKVESHISDRGSYYAGQLLVSARKAVRYSVLRQ